MNTLKSEQHSIESKSSWLATKMSRLNQYCSTLITYLQLVLRISPNLNINVLMFPLHGLQWNHFFSYKHRSSQCSVVSRCTKWVRLLQVCCGCLTAVWCWLKRSSGWSHESVLKTLCRNHWLYVTAPVIQTAGRGCAALMVTVTTAALLCQYGTSCLSSGWCNVTVIKILCLLLTFTQFFLQCSRHEM